ncbi:MAG: hypothetical protein LBI42_14870 [Chitinispirillales bacterium]|jgi:hypothetical protein|nr:hypothetical protein [Chitinispirillales bacterium]
MTIGSIGGTEIEEIRGCQSIDDVERIILERVRVKEYEYYNKIVYKRIKTFLKAYSDLIEIGKYDGNKFTVNRSLAANAIEHYVKDLRALKNRYKIHNNVQSPKIAGLMVNAIMKYRPIVPKNGNESGIRDININEMVAIYHGFVVCAEDCYDIVKKFFNGTNFNEWLKSMIYILKHRNFTAESLYMIFQTVRDAGN